MKREDRAQLIRQSCTRSFLVSFGKPVTLTARGVAIAGNPGAKCNVKVQVKYFKLPKPTGRGYVSLGAMQSREPSKWVQTADPIPALTVTPKRRRGKNPLSIVAQQPPDKLPVDGSLKGQPKCIAFRKRENQSAQKVSESKT